MKKHIQKYAGVLLASAVVITGVASAAITPIPTISNTFAVSGQVIKSADLNLLAQAINVLDTRTNGMTPTDPNHLADKEYVDAQISAISLTSGPQGPAGPTGATGATGPAGPQGPSGPVDNLGNHTATQALNMSSQLINNVSNPVAAQDAATKSYVDAAVAAAGGGDAGSGAPDISGLTGFGQIQQVNYGNTSYAFFSNDGRFCSELGTNWHIPSSVINRVDIAKYIPTVRAGANIYNSLLCIDSSNAYQLLAGSILTQMETQYCGTSSDDKNVFSNTNPSDDGVWRVCAYKQS